MKLAVIIPVFNGSRLLRQTLIAVNSGTRAPDELVVVDDGSTDTSSVVAEQLGAHVILMPQNSGPAACRNLASLATSADILVFIDADTCVHNDTLERIANRLSDDPDLTAVIGSYDDVPSDPSLCSQYRNLAHCYVHHSANRNALTFWSGCGAVRRSAFLQAGGFDERYRRPSVEDIELGYRMSSLGARILLDPDIVVTHTKRWTVWNSIKTDIVHRGIPWMTLLIERGAIPDDLNIRMHHRVAVISTLAFSGSLCYALLYRSTAWVLLSCMLAAIALSTDAGLLRFLYRERGWSVAAVGAGMTLIQNVCKFVAVIGGATLFAFQSRSSSRRRRGERRSLVRNHQDSFENEPLRLQ
jgi:glycosyltransferase involved in cell wall biosynthesis